MRRRGELSVMNIVLCMIVVFIHVSSEAVSGLNKESWQYFSVMLPWRGVSFVVPGFIFLSGMKFALKSPDNFDYTSFYFKKLKYIVVPYLIWNVIYYAWFIREGVLNFSAAELVRYMLDGTLVGHLYFIIVIVQFYLLAPLWHYLLKLIRVSVLIASAFVISLILANLPNIMTVYGVDAEFAFLDRFFATYLIYWILGCSTSLCKDFSKKLNKGLPLLFVVCAVLLVWDIRLYYLAVTGILYSKWLPGVHICFCVLMPLLVLGIADIVKSDKLCSSRVFSLTDRATFAVYLCHCLILFAVDKYLNKADIASVGTRYLIRAACVYTLSFGLCVVWQIIKEKTVKKR